MLQVRNGSTAPVVVEQVLQMKSSQFLRLALMPEHQLCIQFRQIRQRIKFAPTPFIHTPHGNLADAILKFRDIVSRAQEFGLPIVYLEFLSNSLILLSAHEVIQLQW